MILASGHSNWDDYSIIGDVEDFPGEDTGWNELMPGCWTVASEAPIPAALDQATPPGILAMDLGSGSECALGWQREGGSNDYDQFNSTNLLECC